MMKHKYVSLLFIFFGLYSCDPAPQPVDGDVIGWAPVYSQDTNLQKIMSDTPHVTLHAGKIYAKGHFIFQNEVDKGIHVIDIANPAAPREIAFIRSVGSRELAIKGNYLYTNNLNDIVVVDISNPLHVQEVARLKDAFSTGSDLYPPGHGYFECVDPTKGTVIGWEQKMLHHPTCYR